MPIESANDNYETIHIRRQHEYPPEEWARMATKWDKAEKEHGPGYCIQALSKPPIC